MTDLDARYFLCHLKGVESTIVYGMPAVRSWLMHKTFSTESLERKQRVAALDTLGIAYTWVGSPISLAYAYKDFIYRITEITNLGTLGGRI